jgi:hypothetical protein
LFVGLLDATQVCLGQSQLRTRVSQLNALDGSVARGGILLELLPQQRGGSYQYFSEHRTDSPRTSTTIEPTISLPGADPGC